MCEMSRFKQNTTQLKLYDKKKVNRKINLCVHKITNRLKCLATSNTTILISIVTCIVKVLKAQKVILSSKKIVRIHLCAATVPEKL